MLLELVAGAAVIGMTGTGIVTGLAVIAAVAAAVVAVVACVVAGVANIVAGAAVIVAGAALGVTVANCCLSCR